MGFGHSTLYLLMKTVTSLAIALFLLITHAQFVFAQTVYAGESQVDKDKLPGLYLTLQGDGKQIEKDWATELQKYGRASSSRGVYRILNADISSVSSEPINLVSSVKTSRNSATVFVSFNLGNNNYVKAGDPGYAAAESLLKNFAQNTAYNQEVQLAESSFDDAQKSHQKTVKNGERLAKALENNAKEKERLLKKLDDNAKELEQIQKDIESNKTDQSNAATELDNRKKNVEAVKARKTN